MEKQSYRSALGPFGTRKLLTIPFLNYMRSQTVKSSLRFFYLNDVVAKREGEESKLFDSKLAGQFLNFVGQ